MQRSASLSVSSNSLHGMSHDGFRVGCFCAHATHASRTIRPPSSRVGSTSLIASSEIQEGRIQHPLPLIRSFALVTDLDVEVVPLAQTLAPGPGSGEHAHGHAVHE